MPSTSPPYRLEELLALNDEILSLARVELPLDPHLGQMSRELTGRQKQLTADLAGRLAAGQPLDEAITTVGPGLGPVYQAVLAAGLRSGNLTAALEDLTTTARRVQQLRTAYLTAAVYPAVILILAGLFAATVGAEQLRQMRMIVLDSPGGSDSMALQVIDWVYWLQPVYWALLPLGGLLLLVVGVLYVWPSPLFLGNSLITRVLPGARKVARNSQWAMLFDQLSLLIRYETPLPQAVRLASEATGNRALARLGNQWAERLARGETTSPPHQLAPLSRWLLKSNLPPEALASSLAQTARGYHHRALRDSQWISQRLPVYATLLLGGVAVTGYLAMLILPWLTILQQLLQVSTTSMI